MPSPTDLPLRAFICTGCGWLNRGDGHGECPSHHKRYVVDNQYHEGAPCPGAWKPVIVYDEQAIDVLGTAFYRTLDPDAPRISVTIHRRPA